MGYSTLSTKGWDVEAFQAAQAEKDRQIELVLERILTELKRLHTAQATLGRNLPDLLVSGRPYHVHQQMALVFERILTELMRLHTAQATLGKHLPDLLVSGTGRPQH